MYFVAEYVVIAAPRADGWQTRGVVVLSTTKGTPCLLPISASCWTGSGIRQGLEMTSPNRHIVRSSMARSNVSGFRGSAVLTLIPRRFNVLWSKFQVLPYRYGEATTLSPTSPLDKFTIARNVAA